MEDDHQDAWHKRREYTARDFSVSDPQGLRTTATPARRTADCPNGRLTSALTWIIEWPLRPTVEPEDPLYSHWIAAVWATASQQLAG